jgi:pyruvate dehydrogenase E1 component
VLAVTSADRLNAGWTAAHARPHAAARSRRMKAISNGLLGTCSRHCKLDHGDRRPPGDAGLARLCSSATSTIPLGVEHFGQTGTIGDLYAHFGIDAAAIARTAIGLSDGKPGTPRLIAG